LQKNRVGQQKKSTVGQQKKKHSWLAEKKSTVGQQKKKHSWSANKTESWSAKKRGWCTYENRYLVQKKKERDISVLKKNMSKSA
jgi:hypothetical protein